MNRNQKIIVSIVGITIVLLALLGLTYAYYLTRIEGNTNTNSISITTADLKLVYGDGNNIITASNIIPNTNITGDDGKTFTVTNNGNSKIENYVVALEHAQLENVIPSIYKYPNDFEITLTCESNIENKTCRGYSGKWNNENFIMNYNDIEVGETHNYKLSIFYKDSGIDQSDDMGKNLNLKVQIYNSSEIAEIEGTVSGMEEGDMVTLNSEPKVSPIINKNGLLYFRFIGVKADTHTLKTYSKKDAQTTEKEIIVKRGTTPSVEDNIYTFTEEENVIKLNTNVNTNILTSTATIASKKLNYIIMNDDRITKNEGTPIFNSKADYVITDNASSGEIGMYSTEDDYGTSWYFRGAQTHNYVKFAGFMWRIVRINGDNTIRLTLDGVLQKVKAEGTDTYASPQGTKFNSSVNSNAYVGYMYGVPRSSSYKLEHEFTYGKENYIPATETTAAQGTAGHSDVKVDADRFYNIYINKYIGESNIKYSDYIADTLFCGDKSLSSNSLSAGYSTLNTEYAGMARFYTSTNPVYPTLICTENVEDDYSRYTVDVQTLKNGNKTNGDLTFPIGLLSADEVVLAGAYWGENNYGYYLSNPDFIPDNKTSTEKNWWTMTSKELYNNGTSGSHFTGSFGNFSLGSVGINYNFYINTRPVINLKSSVLVEDGDGTKANPYIVKLSS